MGHGIGLLHGKMDVRLAADGEIAQVAFPFLIHLADALGFHHDALMGDRGHHRAHADGLALRDGLPHRFAANVVVTEHRHSLLLHLLVR